MLKLHEVSEQQEQFHKHYEEVNRSKYTLEKRRQLSSLLGSSASGDMINSAINHRHNYLNEDFHGNDNRRETNCTDSGVGSENDRFLENYSSDSSLNIAVDEGASGTMHDLHVAEHQPNNYLNVSHVKNKPKKDRSPKMERLNSVELHVRQRHHSMDENILNRSKSSSQKGPNYDCNYTDEESSRLLNGIVQTHKSEDTLWVVYFSIFSEEHSHFAEIFKFKALFYFTFFWLCRHPLLVRWLSVCFDIFLYAK